MLYDANATTTELATTRIEMALLPVGAIEQHSQHLPLGTDWLAAQALARRVGELLGQERNVLLLPALPYSLSQCHGSLPGSVWLRPETLADILRDAVQALMAQGIRRIAIVNGHGGNFILDEELRELNRRLPGLILLDAAQTLEAKAPGASGWVKGGDIHAGAGETSTMLHLDPAHVGPERRDHVPDVGREFLDYATMPTISPDGAWGRPSQGSAEAGREAFEHTAAALARGIPQAFRRIEALRGGQRLCDPRPPLTAEHVGTCERANVQTSSAVQSPVLDWHNTSWHLRANPPELAILPLGALEQFGPHLPLGTQNELLDAIARRVAERLAARAYLLPTLPLGQSGAYSGFAGTLALSWRTLLAALTDLVESLLFVGVRRVVVIAGLGGAGCTSVFPRENSIAKTAVRQLNYAHAELDAIWVQPLTVAQPHLGELLPGAEEDVHAGQVVTSLMLHLHPERVRAARSDHIPPAGAVYADALPFAALCPEGVWGRPSLASAEMGERILSAAVAGTVCYIEESLAQLAKMKHRG